MFLCPYINSSAYDSIKDWDKIEIAEWLRALQISLQGRDGYAREAIANSINEKKVWFIEHPLGATSLLTALVPVQTEKGPAVMAIASSNDDCYDSNVIPLDKVSDISRYLGKDPATLERLVRERRIGAALIVVFG